MAAIPAREWQLLFCVISSDGLNPPLCSDVAVLNERQALQLLVTEVEPMQGLEIFLQLLDAADTDEHRGDSWIAQQP